MNTVNMNSSQSTEFQSSAPRDYFLRGVSRIVLATFISSAVVPPFAYASTGVASAVTTTAATAPKSAVAATPTNSTSTTSKSLPQSASKTSTASTGADSKVTTRFRVPSAKVRAPFVSNAAFNTKFLASASSKSAASAGNGKSVALASLAGGPSTPTAPAAPTAADLAETDEVVLTPAVRALALSLNNNPVQIVNWVHNNVRYAATYGASQSADLVLQTRVANDFDSASLVIALLRAANIPARYGYGTIEIPSAQVQNWVGGVSTPEAALTLLGQGGIPSQAVVSGGVVSAIQMEHVWVEAFVDFSPSRGAVNRSNSLWVPMDASFQQYTYTQGMAVLTGVALDGNALANLLQQGATVAPDGVTHLNESALPTSFSNYQNQINAYIVSQKPAATVGDVLGTQSTVQSTFPILSGTLPYKTIAYANRYAVVPDALRWAIKYGLYASDAARTQGAAIVNVQRSFALAAGQKFTLQFTAATPADQTALNSALAVSPFPSYLNGFQFHLTAKLSMGGQPIAAGGSFLMGTGLVGGVSLFDPRTGTWTDEPSHAVVAGETDVLAAAPAGVSAAQLNASHDRLVAVQTALNNHQYTGLAQDDITGEMLYFASLAYLANAESNARLLRRAANVAGFPLPSVVRSTTVAQQAVVNGVPQAVGFPGVALTTEVYSNTALALNGASAPAINYQRTLGQISSAYAHLMLERLFSDAQHVAVGASAVRALARANESGQKLFTVTAANEPSVITQLTLEDATKTLIANSALAGQSVLTSQGDVSIANWNGAGYVLESTDTGAGSYEITNRLSASIYPSGGWSILALSGNALAAGQGAATGTGLLGIIGQAINYNSAVTALLGDYSAAPWSTFVGAPIVDAGWWTNVMSSGLAGPLGNGLTGLASSIGVNLTTGLTGVPTTIYPPAFSSTPVKLAGVGQPYQYFATATDPNGLPMTFSLVTGAPGMSMSGGGLLAWASPVAGVYPITIRVSDGKASADQTFTLTVGATLPLQLALAIAPQFVNPSDTVTINVATTGGTGVVTKSLTIDGVATSLDANGQVQITAGAAGGHLVVATASDSSGTISKTSFYASHDAALVKPPLASITTPANDAQVTAPVNIIGTASSTRLVQYQLLLGAAGTGNLTQFAVGYANVSSGVLGKFDPSLLANGMYDIVLVATDANGQQTLDKATYEVTGNLKVGNFTVSFLDVSVDAAGIPIRVTRTYDSRRRGDPLDFGYGWTVDYQNVRVQKNITTGLGWNIVQNQLQLCVSPSGPRKVNITLPTGKVERFTAALTQTCALGQVPTPVVNFVAQSDTTSTLTATTPPNLLAQNGNLIDADTLMPWNPTQFTLTTIDGLVYTLDQDFGIKQVKEPNGNTLTFTNAGIVHSNGQSVTFTRDGNGRITAITDPAGAKVTYTYATNGDLITVTDRGNQSSQLTYNNAHGLLTFTDPRGVQLARNEYDDSGRLTAQYDAQGNKLDLAALDLNANKQTVKDRRGNSTTYLFDSQGNVTSITDALGGVTAYTYDALGNELTKTDPLGHTVTKTFTADSNPLSEKDPLGNTTTYNWTPHTQQMNSYTDARGNTTQLVYSGTGNLGSITDGNGNVTGLGYDASGNLTVLTDAAGNKTQYAYDTKGNRIQETDPTGAVTTYTYDSAGHQLTQSRTRTVNGAPVTMTTTRTVDADGNVLTETDPAGGITATTYNALKKIATQTDAAGHVTTYSYDSRGNLAQVSYPDGTSESTTYDAENNTSSETDRAGRTTSYTYDALNRLTTTTFPDGKTSTNVYDAAGHVTSVTDERGNTSGNTFDAAGRATQASDALGNITLNQYDAVGNLTQMTDAMGNVTRYTYDAANRRTKTTLAAINGVNDTITIGYDAAGRKVSETDQAGNITQYGYDKAGRLTQVTDAIGGITTYTYDEAGNKLSQTDALNHTTRWDYDNLGRVTKRTLPAGQAETFTFDNVGNVATHTDFNGVTTTYTYDSANRVANAQSPASGNTPAYSVSYTYTASGQVATVTDANGTITHTYDNRDRLASVQNPDSSVLTYTYDAAGNRTSVTTQFGAQAPRTVAYGYDALNRLNKVTDPDGNITTYTFDAVGNPKSTALPNGLRTDYFYDARNRLTKIEHRRNSDNALLGSIAYTLSANNLRTQVVENISTTPTANPTRIVSYQYDKLGRLTKESDSVTGRTVNYTLDAVGNRISADGPLAGSSTFDANDRIQTAGISGVSYAYSYDANGNTTQVQTTTGGATTTATLSWDANNRLIGQGVTQGGATVSSSFNYDADGNRLNATRGTSPTTSNATLYVVDKNRAYAQAIEERDGNGGLIVSYTYDDRGPVSQTRNVGTPANPSWVTSYYLNDGLGSVRLLADATGGVTNSYTYGAYGEMLAQGSGVNAVTNNVLFAGEQFDSTLGLSFNRARYYNPATGRFVSVDPWSGEPRRPITLNKYLYASADPIDRVDPFGTADLVELNLGQGIQTKERTVEVTLARTVPKKIGCELVAFAANEAVTYGIYVLTDGVSFYVGQSNDINRRLLEHGRDVAKKGFSILGRVAVQFLPGQVGKDILRLSEQAVIDAFRESGANLINRVEAIGENGRLRGALDKIKTICK